MLKIRILVVDDSVVVRRMLTNILSGDLTIEVVGTAPNGRIALAKITQVNPDLILLDVAMPEMDGLETLAAIRKTHPQLPVIMFSVLTKLAAMATLDALALGANDYVTKPAKMGSKEAVSQYIRRELIPKINLFHSSSVVERTKLISRSPSQRQSRSQLEKSNPIKIIAIGGSTGGPEALYALLSELPANFQVPVLIVQHMPPVFTKLLAERLTAKCQIRVDEGKTGDLLEPGQVWIAPGDYHLIVERDGTKVRLRTNQAPPENSCRPSVDVLFRSVARIYQDAVLAIVLTGMGQDGLHGCECIREVGGQVLVQDKASSVVWGMPGIVANAGLADRILPLDRMASEIISKINSNT